MLTVKSTINIAGQTVPQIIPVVQGDTGRAILFTLADFTIPQDATATYYIQKPSGEAVYNVATIDGNTVLVELTAQSIIEAGDNYGQVRIESDGEIVTSFDFILLVKPFRGIDAVESTTEMNIFDKAVEQAEEAIDEAKVEALEEIAQAGSGNIAEEFDAANSYLAGEYTIYEAKLYRFTSNHTGLWTGSDAEEVTVGDELTDINEELTEINEDLTDVKSQLSDTQNEALSAYATATASGAIASFPDGADGVPVKSLIVDIEPVQSGSGDPSPSNVRPISGWTGVKVTRTGKNLFDGVIEDGTINQYGQNQTQEDRYRAKNYIAVKPGEQYVISKNGSAQAVNWRLYDKDKTFMSGVNMYGNPFTVPSGCYYIRFFSDDAINVSSGLQIEVGSTVTAYEEPHIAEPYTVNWQSEAGTVYGGTLDVTTGVLTMDRAFITLNGSESNTWYFGSDGIRQTVYTGSALLPNVKTTGGYQQNAACNAFKMINSSSQRAVGCAYVDNGYFNMVFAPDTFSTSNDVKAWLTSNNVQLVYELATPQTIQLTPTEVRSLLGMNNIFADTGDSDVQYRADTKLYIEKLTAPTEDDMIADHAIAANSFFMVGNTLYRATTAIASGATITVGTNATKMSLSEALNTLS